MAATSVLPYVPLATAAAALVGVLITLLVTGRREEARHRLVREDDYRREQRTAIAAVATGAHAFRRAAGAASAPGALAAAGRDRARGMLAAADSAGAELLAALTVARLVVADGALQDAVDGLYTAWARTGRSLADVAAAYGSGDGPGLDSAAATADAALGELDTAGAVVQSVALEVLLPTVAGQIRRRR